MKLTGPACTEATSEADEDDRRERAGGSEGRVLGCTIGWLLVGRECSEFWPTISGTSLPESILWVGKIKDAEGREKMKWETPPLVFLQHLGTHRYCCDSLKKIPPLSRHFSEIGANYQHLRATKNH